jgi:competence protein ComEC
MALLGVAWTPAWDLAAALADGLMAFLQTLSTWRWASGSVAAAPPWVQAAGLLGAALCVLRLPVAVRLLGALLVLPMLWPVPDRPTAGEFELLGVDIGQGNAVLVRTARHTLLYDTGPLIGRDGDAGERVLLPLLGALGERRLDLLMLSHRDADHTGGAAAVLKGVRVQRLSSSLEPGHPLRSLAPHQPCRAGQRWQWDGVTFSILHPLEADAERAAQGRLKPNGLSCVLRIDNGRRSALLTGDIERLQELAILARHGLDPGQVGAPPDPELPQRLRADVLLVPHHGSRTSSTQNWIVAVQPTWALVQAGYRNRYGHPAADVMDRYLMHGIGVVRTDVCGAWHWHSASAAPWCERDRQRRYWHAPREGDGPEFAKDDRPTQVTR